MHRNPIPFESIKEKTHFYFLRHGESEGNRKRMIQGHVDLPLTSLGRDHARSAGLYFQEKGLDAILSSPLSRALETAEIVAGHNNVDAGNIIRRDALKELDTGIFSGLTFDEIQSQYPEEWNSFQHHSWEAVPSAERLHQLMERGFSVWNEMIELANRGNRRILSVSHGGLIQWIYKLSFSDRWENWLPVIRTGNCGIYHLAVTPVPGDESTQGPGYYSEWVRINHLPY
ncbi:histidine phosphatase family protein [Salinispira pacifica]|uniref:Phosphoglycerate mutase family n=1 Tax=Salinispira pacifica TaxID=1307761 RepID=V5WDA8_9SPIO|nr:histidine phosphatase family protein [Salinispira pacifica]AHC13529.1 Phosphoglycerate mutase family [Salinispira pacifica]